MHTLYKTRKDKIIHPHSVGKHCWIDISSPTEEDLRELQPVLAVSDDIILSIKDIDEVPKVEKHDNFDFILIQTPLMLQTENEAGEQETSYSIVPLGIMYTPELVITISEGTNDVIEYVKEKLKNYHNNKIIDTERIPQFILKLLLFTEKIYLRYLKTINQKIRASQANLGKVPHNEEIINLMNLEKSLVYFSTSIHSNHVVFEKLFKRAYFKGCEEDEELAEDILDESKQALETVKIYSKIVTNLSNTFASIISNNLNQTVKFLTSVTIVLMIPTLVASLYGMNVELPFQHTPHAFLIIMVASVLLSVAGIVVLFRKKFF